jgi:hypothetical protein
MAAPSGRVSLCFFSNCSREMHGEGPGSPQVAFYLEIHVAIWTDSRKCNLAHSRALLIQLTF